MLILEHGAREHGTGLYVTRYAGRRTSLPPEFIPHSLRHLYASTSLAEGIPITEVSRWLGHKSIEVTHQIYGNSRELHQTGEKPTGQQVTASPEQCSARPYRDLMTWEDSAVIPSGA